MDKNLFISVEVNNYQSLPGLLLRSPLRQRGEQGEHSGNISFVNLFLLIPYFIFTFPCKITIQNSLETKPLIEWMGLLYKRY